MPPTSYSCFSPKSLEQPDLLSACEDPGSLDSLIDLFDGWMDGYNYVIIIHLWFQGWPSNG